MRIENNVLIEVEDNDIPADGCFIIPQSVIAIGSYAFKGCEKLTTLTIPQGVTRIGQGTFKDCVNLQSISLPTSLLAIEEYAFLLCKSLSSVVVPYGVATINHQVFQGCENLTTLFLPQGITIKNSAFYQCSKLSIIVIEAGTLGARQMVKDQLQFQLQSKVISKQEYDILQQKKLECLLHYFQVLVAQKQIKNIIELLSPIQAHSFFSVVPIDLLNGLTLYAIEAHPDYKKALPELAKLEIPVIRDEQKAINWDEYQKQFSVLLAAHLNVLLMNPIPDQAKLEQSDISSSHTKQPTNDDSANRPMM